MAYLAMSELMTSLVADGNEGCEGSEGWKEGCEGWKEGPAAIAGPLAEVEAYDATLLMMLGVAID